MQLFYTPDITSNTYSLNEEEARHCLKVLRLQKGDVVHLTNGKGTLYKAQITHIDKISCEVEVIETIEEYGKRNHYLHIAIAPTKNSDRLEWFLEKATEIGIDEITPLICERSVKEKLRVDRLNKIITSAVKQSVKAYYPKLNEASPLAPLLRRGEGCVKLIAHCNSNETVLIQKIVAETLSNLNQSNTLQNANSSLLGRLGGASYLVLIGPEGDFTSSEIELAMLHQFIPISLGKSRLRTETAGVYACTVINSLNEV